MRLTTYTNPDIGPDIRKHSNRDVTSREKGCDYSCYRPQGPWRLQPGHPGGGQQDLVRVRPAGVKGDKLKLEKIMAWC